VKKVDFLNELRGALIALSTEEREEIIRDQEEYIRDAVAAGRDEETVVASLGSPHSFAAQLTVESKIARAEVTDRLPEKFRNVFGAVLAILALAPFNFIVVLGPFLALVGLNIAGWAVSMSAIFAAAMVLGVFLFKLTTFAVGIYTHLAALFLCLGLVGAGILGVILMFALTRFFLKATASYLRWNLKLIEGKV
jgi:uncharacterized membrane protein